MTAVESIYNQIYDQLKDKFDTDTDFQNELENLLHFYGRKFINHAKSDEQLHFIENQLEDIVKSQFFKGYYVMKSMLLDEESHFPDDVWTLNKGIIRNELPILFETIFESNQEEWHRTDLAHNIGMKLVQMFDGVYEIVKQMRKDIALYGAYKAFIEDERYRGEQEQSNPEVLIGNPFDLEFLNPQIYMQSQFITNEQEIWDLFMWSSIKQSGGWVGTIHLSRLPIEESENYYILQCSLSETIAQNEKYEILNQLITSLPDHISSVLQTRVYHVRELETLIPNE